MRRFLFALLIVFIQETVTLNGLLVEVRQGFSSIWIITALFTVATVIDIFVGYWLGRAMKRRFKRGPIRVFARKWIKRLQEYIGRHGRKVYMLLLAYFSFPYINAFIAAWLDIPFGESLLYLFLGNMLFYVTSWLLVLGVMSIIPNPFIAFGLVIILTVAVTVAMRVWKSRKI